MKKLLVAMLAAVAMISSSYGAIDIHCKSFKNESMSSQGYFDLPVDIEINGQIDVEEDNRISLSNGHFYMVVDPEYDNNGKLDYFWHEEDVPFERIYNKENYKPRVYKGHVKFEDFAPIFGKADLIIKRDDLLNLKSGDVFKGNIILSWIADHWGGSRSLECKAL